MFGGRLPNLQGLEYYKGGGFEFRTAKDKTKNTNMEISSLKLKSSSSKMIDEWDWRDRHGKNWMTSVKDQNGCGSCVVHGHLGAVKAITNLYFNDSSINLNLSEQNLMSCMGTNSFGYPRAMFYTLVTDYLKDTGVVDESCFPYEADFDYPCNNICNSPSEELKISDGIYGHYYLSSSEFTWNIDTIKKMLIEYGPAAMSLRYPGGTGHCVTLCGYYIGWYSHRWIYKNSWGADWGRNGYGEFRFDFDDDDAIDIKQGGLLYFNYGEIEIIN